MRLGGVLSRAVRWLCDRFCAGSALTLSVLAPASPNACTVSALSDIGIPVVRRVMGPPAFLCRLMLCRPRHEPRRGDLVNLPTALAEMLSVEPHGLAHRLSFLTRANMYRVRLHICYFLPELKYLPLSRMDLRAV